MNVAYFVPCNKFKAFLCSKWMFESLFKKCISKSSVFFSISLICNEMFSITFSHYFTQFAHVES